MVKLELKELNVGLRSYGWRPILVNKEEPKKVVIKEVMDSSSEQ